MSIEQYQDQQYDSLVPKEVSSPESHAQSFDNGSLSNIEGHFNMSASAEQHELFREGSANLREGLSDEDKTLIERRVDEMHQRIISGLPVFEDRNNTSTSKLHGKRYRKLFSFGPTLFFSKEEEAFLDNLIRESQQSTDKNK